MVERTVGGLGLQLVDVERLGAGLLRVTMEAADGIKVEDCERVSRQLSHLFAVEDVDYERLEVSSPGLDRLIKGADNFVRFVGSEINVHLYSPLAEAGGRKRLRGHLLDVVGIEGSERLHLRLTQDEDTAKGVARKPRRGATVSRRAEVKPALVVEIALADIDKARLVPELNFRPAPAEGRTKSGAVGMSEAMTSTSGSLGSEQT
ncbi:MAG: ribosome maturation factor RimP [Burkholderiaceae bacterium]|nr:ribosome maturation factor RimP [Burkholderiaceae bacterium]